MDGDGIPNNGFDGIPNNADDDPDTDGDGIADVDPNELDIDGDGVTDTLDSNIPGWDLDSAYVLDTDIMRKPEPLNVQNRKRSIYAVSLDASKTILLSHMTFPSAIPRISFLIIIRLKSSKYSTFFAMGNIWPVNFTSPTEMALPFPLPPIIPRQNPSNCHNPSMPRQPGITGSFSK